MAVTTTTTIMLPLHHQLPPQSVQPTTFNWQLEDYAYFRKCGEITTSPDMQNFGFNCSYCPAICLQIDIFMEHITSQHAQDVLQRYEGVDEKLEQATQTDLMIMDDDDIDVFQIDKQTATTTSLELLDKRIIIKKSNGGNESTTSATTMTITQGLLHMDIDLMNIMDNATTPTPALATTLESDVSDINVNVDTPTLLQLAPVVTGTTTTTSTKTTTTAAVVEAAAAETEIDFVYIMENLLPPSPPPSADISSDNEHLGALQSPIDPFASLHDVTDDTVIPPTEMLQTAAAAATTITAIPPIVQHELRYETRRVAMQRKLRESTNVVELTPPATPTAPAATTPSLTSVLPTSPTSSMVSMADCNCSLSNDSSTAACGANKSQQQQQQQPQPQQQRRCRELERNRPFVSELLIVYERHEKLWNPKHPQYKYNAKRSVYSELAAPLESAFQLRLSGAEIFAILKELRSRYRRELSKLNALGGKYKSRLWYFNKMHFLRSIIEHKRAEREAKNINDSTESEKSCETDTESSKSTQYREVLSYILDAFKHQECLWNPLHPEFSTSTKTEFYNEISNQLKENLNYELSGDECFTEIQKLKTRYRKELRMVIQHKGLYLPKLWCYDEMEFLHKILQEQIFNKISKKVGIVGTSQKTKFISANCIQFKSQNEELQFVEIYRNYPALWKVDHPDFRSNTYRNQALNQMLNEMNKTFNMSHTSDQLEKTLFELRKNFSTQKRKILTNSNNGSSSCSSISIVHAQLSQFLEQNLGPFRCEICEQMIKTCDQYKLHKSEHDGTQPFMCTLCGKGFQMPCNLTVHIRRHRQDFPYACGECDKRFATSTEVAIHMRTHTGQRPYICDLCGKSFKTWSFFDIHRRTHLNQSTFHCPICDKGFYEKNRFTDHMNGHLNIRKHLCTVCGKTFTTYGNLKKHSELHLTVKKYKCSICGKRFAQFASLRWHKKREHDDDDDTFEP